MAIYTSKTKIDLEDVGYSNKITNKAILKILENGKEVAAIIDLIVNNSFTNSNTSVRNSYVLSNNENTKVNAILNVEKENNFFNSDYGYLIIKYKNVLNNKKDTADSGIWLLID